MHKSVLGDYVMQCGYEQMSKMQFKLADYGVNQVQKAECTTKDYLSTSGQALILD